jgi:hypothetical protein
MGVFEKRAVSFVSVMQQFNTAGARRPRLFYFSQRIAVRIRLPVHAFEVLNQLLAARVDEQPHASVASLQQTTLKLRLATVPEDERR